MGLIQYLFGRQEAATHSAPRADVGVEYISLDDPRLREIIRGGIEASGPVNVAVAMRNPTVFRSVMLISSAIGMLPFHLKHTGTKENAKEHPLYRVLHRQPNKFQSAFDFRSLMQMRALTEGDAYALVVRSKDIRAQREKIVHLVPLDPSRVHPRLNESSWEVEYEYQARVGGRRIYQQRDIFHLRGVSMDGLRGMSLVKQAAEAIRIAILADTAVRNLFQKGSFVGGVLSVDSELSPAAYDRLKASWNEDHSGASNAGATPLLEGGTKYQPIGASAKDAQSNETRARQVEEIARVFGVPRPLLMVDETGWGTGIDVLGQFFVRYALGPWFEAWQQASERTLLDDDEKGELEAKFNAGALIRGSMKDQGEFFARALGSGGHRPWMTANEVRDLQDMPEHPDGDSLENPMGPGGGVGNDDSAEPGGTKPGPAKRREEDEDE